MAGRRLPFRLGFAIAAIVLFTSCESRGNALRGKDLFYSTCTACHYSNSTVAKAGPGLKGIYQKRALPNGAMITDENMEAWIRKGNGYMPGYHDMITKEQMRDLLAYLKTL